MSTAALVGKLALMKPAIKAPAMAMPAPTPAVDSSKALVFELNARAAMDTQSTSRATSRTGSRPKRRASHGVGSASNPMRRSGMVVSSEAAACVRWNSSMIDLRIGPTETIPGRSAMATTTIAVIANHGLCTSSPEAAAPGAGGKGNFSAFGENANLDRSRGSAAPSCTLRSAT